MNDSNEVPGSTSKSARVVPGVRWSSPAEGLQTVRGIQEWESDQPSSRSPRAKLTERRRKIEERQLTPYEEGVNHSEEGSQKESDVTVDFTNGITEDYVLFDSNMEESNNVLSRAHNAVRAAMEAESLYLHTRASEISGVRQATTPGELEALETSEVVSVKPSAEDTEDKPLDKPGCLSREARQRYNWSMVDGLLALVGDTRESFLRKGDVTISKDYYEVRETWPNNLSELVPGKEAAGFSGRSVNPSTGSMQTEERKLGSVSLLEVVRDRVILVADVKMDGRFDSISAQRYSKGVVGVVGTKSLNNQIKLATAESPISQPIHKRIREALERSSAKVHWNLDCELKCGGKLTVLKR